MVRWPPGRLVCGIAVIVSVAMLLLPGLPVSQGLSPSTLASKLAVPTNGAASSLNVTWTNLTAEVTGSPLPNATCQGLLAFDTYDNYTVYLAQGVGSSSETLTYRLGQWTNLTGISGPPACGQGAYDPNLQGIVYIPPGGTTPWFFQGGSWSKLSTVNYTTSGPGLNGLGPTDMMTYDAADGYILASDGLHTWSLGSNLTWTTEAEFPQFDYQPSPVSPNTVQPMMAYDAHDNYVLAIDAEGFSYAYSAGEWSNLTANGTNSPTEFTATGLDNISSGSSLAYDPAFSSVILVAGGCSPYNGPGTGCGEPSGDPYGYNYTWAYQSGSWTNITPLIWPSPRSDVGFTYDAADGYMLMVGGEEELYSGSLSIGGSDWQQTWALSNRTVTINPVGQDLSVSATPDPTDVGTPVALSVSFRGGTGPFSYLWSNGATTNETTATFAAAGNYSLSVTVTDSLGTFETGSRDILVHALPSASLTFASRQTVGIVGAFSAFASNGTSPFTYAWDFGDNSKSSVQTGFHSYAQPGNYTVTLVATDALGRSTTASEAVVVAPVIVAALSVTNATPSIEQSILFTTNTTGGLGPFTYVWTGLPFGCDSVNSSSIGCASTQAGTYHVTVNVTDPYPGFGTASINVSVIFEFTVSVSTVTPQVGQNLTLGVQSSTPAADLTYSYSGLPPGCVSANTPELTCTPTEPGSYTVTVTVTDAAAAVSTSHTIILDVVTAPGSTHSPTQTSNTSSGNSYLGPLELGLAVGAAIGALVVVAVVVSRRRRRTPPSEGAEVSKSL